MTARMLLIAGLVIAAGAATYRLMVPTQDLTAEALILPPAALVVPDMPDPPVPPAFTDSVVTPAPWARTTEPHRSDAARRASTPPAQTPGQNRERALAQAQQRLTQLAADPNPDMAALDRTLRDLEAANGSAMLGGVRLDVLRVNLQIADRIAQIGQEMQTMQSDPTGANDPIRTDALQRKSAEIQALQKQLRTDFVSAPAGQP